MKSENQQARSEDLRGDLKGCSENSQPKDEAKDDAEARNGFYGQSKGISFIFIMSNLEFNSTCRRKKTFPIPLKYIDVTRTTHTNLEVFEESRIDDHWNVDVDRYLSNSGQVSRSFTMLTGRPPKEKKVVQGAAHKNSSNYQT